MKKLLWLIIGLVVIVVIAGLLAPHFISSDTVKQKIIAQAEQKTGHHLTIGGDFSIKFFPFAGAHMENVTVSGPISDPTDKTPLMTLKSLNVEIGVLPLLHGGVDVKSLVLEEPKINLIVNKDGKQNWRIEAQGAEPAAAADGKTASGGGNPLAALTNVSLNDVKINDGAVNYEDLSKNEQWVADKVNVSVSLAGVNAPFSINGSADWNKKTINLKTELNSLGSLLSNAKTGVTASIKSDLINIDADGTITDKKYTGKAKIVSSSLRDMLAWAEHTKPAFNPPLALDLSSDTECTQTDCSFTKSALKLDKIDATGDVKIIFGSKIPNITVNLNMGELDLNPFLPEEKKAASLPFISDADAASAPWSTAPIDLSAMRQMDVTANIATTGIKIKNISIGKTTLSAKLQDAKLALNIPECDLYGGKISTTVDVDASGAEPAVQKKFTMKGVQLQPLLKDANGSSRLSGTADMEGTVSGHGKSQQQIVSTLAGNGDVKISNGSLKGVNFAELISQAKNLLNGKAPSGSSKETDFSEMGGSFTIANGIVSNKDLSMKSTGMQLAGQGEINLPAWTINYRMTPQIGGQAKANGKTSAGVGVPILITGSLDNPSYMPDVKGLLQNNLQNLTKNPQQAIQNVLGGTKNSDGTTSKPKLKNLLGGLR